MLVNFIYWEQARPSSKYITELMPRILRRAGILPKGWRTKDVLHLNSTLTLACHYAGTHIIAKKLKIWSKVAHLLAKIATRGIAGSTCSRVLDDIAAEGLPGLQGVDQYWVNHFGRLLADREAGIVVGKGFEIDTLSLQRFLHMGRGASKLKLLGSGLVKGHKHKETKAF